MQKTAPPEQFGPMTYTYIYTVHV